MTSVKLTAAALLLTFGTLGPLDKCKKGGDVADADVADSAPAESASAPSTPETPPETPAEEETVTVDAGAGKPPTVIHVPAKPKDGGAAKDSGATADAGKTDAGAADAGAGKDGGAVKGFLPPKVDITNAAPHYDEAAVVAKIHTADVAVGACYIGTGKDPGFWNKRSYDVSFDAKGKVTLVEPKQTDSLMAACVKTALTTLSLGEPKDKAAGKFSVHMTTK